MVDYPVSQNNAIRFKKTDAQFRRKKEEKTKDSKLENKRLKTREQETKK